MCDTTQRGVSNVPIHYLFSQKTRLRRLYFYHYLVKFGKYTILRPGHGMRALSRLQFGIF